MNRHFTTKRTKDTKPEGCWGIHSSRLLRDLRAFVVEAAVVRETTA
ncbi:MAG: hypothetical protein AB7O66_13685 [Limisphaerales bacterium]